MTATAVVNIVVEQGTDHVESMVWKNSSTQLPRDLTGFTADFQVRAKYEDPLPFLELTTANSGIILGNAQGTVDLIFTAAVTEALTTLKGYYELVLYAPGGQIVPFVKGVLLIKPTLVISD